ncbi:E3 ubiquitin-protein ligase rnf13 [Entomortierella chlamydospora]|uniref:E3 ubiquitin-protein ligase rnf13 n=1 Tax=Entomortierella chlamydospora TaxID=101097 RepID=A0A9P6MVF7_9FUNG|nr:E3 ubiquitin-protein ligase rnf13 [Entomortierella chlamydospora]
MLRATVWLVQCFYCLIFILSGTITIKQHTSIHAYPINTPQSSRTDLQPRQIVANATSSTITPSPTPSVTQKPLMEIIAPNVTLFAVVEPSTASSSLPSPSVSPAANPSLLLPTSSLTIPPSQIHFVNESQLFGAGGAEPLTGVLIEWKIGCDLDDSFPIYPPTDKPWIAFMSSALLSVPSQGNTNTTNGDDDSDSDSDDDDTCDVSTLISIVQAISDEVTGVIMYLDPQSNITFSELREQTEMAIQDGFYIQKPTSDPEPVITAPSIDDRLTKRELGGITKKELLAKLELMRQQRAEASIERQTATKMSTDSESSLGTDMAADAPVTPANSNPSQPLGILAIGDQGLIKTLLTNVNSSDVSVIAQMRFGRGVFNPGFPRGPMNPPYQPRGPEPPRKDRSLGLFFWIILGSVVLIIGVWIFQEDDITYSDDEEDCQNGGNASHLRSRPTAGDSHSRQKDNGGDDQEYQGEKNEKYEYHGGVTNPSAQRVFARVDPATLRRSVIPLAMGRRSVSFDETLYGGLDSSISRRGSSQYLCPERRLSSVSTVALGRNDRCRSWAEDKANFYEDYGGDKENEYGGDQEEEYKSHAREGWTNLKIDGLRPHDDVQGEETPTRVPEIEARLDAVSNLAITPSLIRQSSSPSLRVTPPAETEAARRSSSDLLNGSNLYTQPTLRHKNRFVLPRKIETDHPSLFIIPIEDVVSPTVYGDGTNSAGPSTAGFLPPEGWGGERRRSSHSTVAVPDNGRGIAQHNWGGLREQTLRRSSLQVRRVATQGLQAEGDEIESESGNYNDADDGRGVGQAAISPMKGKQLWRSSVQSHRISLDRSLASLERTESKKEHKDKRSTKSPIEDYKARFSMIGIDLPDIYAPTEGEFSRLSLDADEIIMQSKAYHNRSRGCQHQLDDKDKQEQVEELQDHDDQSNDNINTQMNKSGVDLSEKAAATGDSTTPAGKSLNSTTVKGAKKQRQRKYDPCAICLEEYEVGERLRELPCKHYFHAHCIDPWFKDVHSICPVCKRDYSPARANTQTDVINERSSRMLSFLSPLAVFAAGSPVGAHYWYAAEASAHL